MATRRKKKNSDEPLKASSAIVKKFIFYECPYCKSDKTQSLIAMHSSLTQHWVCHVCGRYFEMA